MKPLNTDDAATVRCSMRSYARMMVPLFLFPIVLKLLEYFLQQRDTCPAWGAPEWKVFLMGELWSALFWVSCLAWAGWWVWKGATRRRAWRGGSRGFSSAGFCSIISSRTNTCATCTTCPTCTCSSSRCTNGRTPGCWPARL